ncbi:MAG: hypothetical protein JRF53_00305 [Deltaproteobacteria bacterium]|nr:hypothetical protein [Deltaproteobacteria bacterium]MBW2342452.1 hypothetical protein [Deltaproteobacteria bacterium]
MQKISPELKKQLETNLRHTSDLVELHHTLKLALYRKLYPDKNDFQLRRLISIRNVRGNFNVSSID